MHELSIVLHLLDAAEKILQENEADTATHIELDIGALTGVEPMAFEFAWMQATQNTRFEHTQLVVQHTPGWALCTNCGHGFGVESAFGICSQCGNHRIDVVAGLQLRIKSITLPELSSS